MKWIHFSQNKFKVKNMEENFYILYHNFKGET